MKITTIQQFFGCSKCESELIRKGNRLVCPNRRWWNNHYRGDAGNIDCICGDAFLSSKSITVDAPDADPSWTPADRALPMEAGLYQTLNTITGQRATLFKSVESGGWWDGKEMWQGFVTHWRASAKEAK